MRALLILLVLGTASCGADSAPPEPGSANVASVAGNRQVAEPQRIVKRFFDALESGDGRASHALLTQAAREQAQRPGGLSFDYDARRNQNVRVGLARVRGSEAVVRVTSEVDGRQRSLGMKLRREEEAWKIYGASMPIGDAEFVIDFERESDAVVELGDELVSGLSDAMEEAFRDARSSRRPDAPAARVTEERRRYNDLRAVDEAAHDAAWRVDLDGAGRPARELVQELLEPSELELDAGVHAEALDTPVDLVLEGVSRLEAIEAVATAAGLVPVYPAATTAWGDELPALRFRTGPRLRPVTFAGPFLLELEELEEFAPRTTGQFVLTVRALGLSPSVMAANRRLVQLLGPLRVVDTAGEGLLKDEDVVFYTNPLEEYGLFVDRTRYELVGLLSSVTSIAEIAGTVRLELPVELHQGQFPRAAARLGQFLTLGAWEANWKQKGKQNTFELRAEDRDLESVRLRFAANDEAGAPIGILSQTAFANGDHVWADLNLPSVPAELYAKLYEVEPVEYEFALQGVPLARHTEQPETIAGLSFSGNAPISVEFVGFVDRSDPEFVKVETRIDNRSNKVVIAAEVTFEYYSRSRALLGDFPHNLSGEFTYEGTAPLVKPGYVTDQEVVAFFVPRGTKNVKIRVDSVSFFDGTTWERDHDEPAPDERATRR